MIAESVFFAVPAALLGFDVWAKEALENRVRRNTVERGVDLFT